MNINSKIYIAGHNGMVGKAILNQLNNKGYKNIVYKSSNDLNLIDQNEVNNFFKQEKPNIVFLAAAKVGGILANNNFRAQFIYENLMIESNIIHASYLNQIDKLLFLGSSCIYPKNTKQPIKEEYLLSDYLEDTNKPYAISKIAGIELCRSYKEQYNCNFISVMPTNLYGSNDNYDLQSSHVLPALIRKFITAKKNNLDFVEIWGTGNPRREFMHVDDLASACIFLMDNYNDKEIINIGWGLDISIIELASLICEILNFKCQIRFDLSKPDGTVRKLLDVTKMKKLGWTPKIELIEGIKNTIDQVYDQF
jgi:GDP-L-fucose synthase